MDRVTPKQVLLQFRLDVDDIMPEGAEDQTAALWSDPEIYYYMDRAQERMCSRAHYLQRELEFVVIPEQEFVTLPVRVTNVREAHLREAGRDLSIRNFNEMGGYVADDYGLQVRGRWRTAHGGPPQIAILDFVMNRIRLVPTPAVADTLLLACEVSPRPVQQCDQFDIPRDDHVWALLPYMKHLAYSKQDADTYDPQRASNFLQEAELEFQRVYDEVQQLRQSGHAGSGTTRYGGIR
jgi:hypothetical protein